jgi:predicted nucleic acid-binding protein
VDAWVESPTLALLTESVAHLPTLRALLAGGHIAGAQVHDARVAALCLRHGVRELWSADRDFSRFAGLAGVNPLVHAN